VCVWQRRGAPSQSARTDPGSAGDRGFFARVLDDASIVHIWLRRIEGVACDASQTPADEKRGELAIAPIRVIDPTIGNGLAGGAQGSHAWYVAVAEAF